MAQKEKLVETLSTWIAEIPEPPEDLQTSQPELSLRDQGLTSLGLLNFLVLIEDKLGVEWDPDTAWEHFESIESIADRMLEIYADSLDQIA